MRRSFQARLAKAFGLHSWWGPRFFSKAAIAPKPPGFDWDNWRNEVERLAHARVMSDKSRHESFNYLRDKIEAQGFSVADAMTKAEEQFNEQNKDIRDFYRNAVVHESILASIEKRQAIGEDLPQIIEELSGVYESSPCADMFTVPFAKVKERVAKHLQQKKDYDDYIAKLNAPIPIPEHLRIHTAIIAKTGWGKTQLLQRLILDELKKLNPPAMIILDSTGGMVGRIQRLAMFNDRLRERLLIIDPAHSPSLNMFDVSNPRFASYSSEQKESTQTELVGLFNYIFASKDYNLTGPQGLGFAYAVRLILSRPGSKLTDLRHLLEEHPKTWEQSAFVEDIRRLDPDTQDFFKMHFFQDTLASTKAAIARRLHTLTAVPAFRRMFTAGSNALDLYSETQEKGSIVLVNTNQQLLGRDGYVLFGRYIIARTMAAVFERAIIPEHERRPTHLIIDEASPYFDDTFDDLLTQVRQFGLRATVAFQHLDQLSDKLKNSVAGQTSVKYVGGMSPIDEGRIAAQIRCEKEFIAALTIDDSNPPKWSEWACYVDGLTKHPMRLQVPFLALEQEPRMSDQQHSTLLEENQKKVSFLRSSPAPSSTVSSGAGASSSIPPSDDKPGSATLDEPESSSRKPEAGATW